MTAYMPPPSEPPEEDSSEEKKPIENLDTPGVPQARGVIPEAEESLPEDAIPPNPHGEPIPVAESSAEGIVPDEARVGRPEEAVSDPADVTLGAD